MFKYIGPLAAITCHWSRPADDALFCSVSSNSPLTAGDFHFNSNAENYFYPVTAENSNGYKSCYMLSAKGKCSSIDFLY